MSVAVVVEPVAPSSARSSAPYSGEFRAMVSALFAVHRRVPVRDADGVEGPVFCTCGDVWPCRNEELASRLLDFPS